MSVSTKKAAQKVSNKKNENIIVKRETGTVTKGMTYICLFLLSLLIVAVPFYRGLYFRENYIPSIIYISAIFLLYVAAKLIKRDFILLTSYMDIAVLLLPITYLISFFFSANMKLAFDSVLKYAAYFMVYKLASELFKEGKHKKIFNYTIIISFFLIAFTGLLALAKLLDIDGAILYNRIYGLYQYPNATGSVLGAGILITIGLLVKETDNKHMLLYQVILSTIFPAFIFTISVGAYLVFAFVFVFYFILFNYKEKLSFILDAFIMSLSSVLFIFDYFKNDFKGPFLIYYIISITLAVLLQVLSIRYVYGRINQASKKVAVILVTAMILAFVLTLAAGLLLNVSVLESAVNKVANIDLKAQNASDRIVFTKDGLRMFADNIIIGAGGGAWQDLYYKYQSFSYKSKEAHNFYIQTMIEVGLIGTLIFAAVLLLLIRKMILDLFIKKDNAYLHIYAGILVVIGHAMIDFDLSLSAPMFLLWFLIGMVFNDSAKELEKGGWHKYVTAFVSLLCITVLVSGISMDSGISYGNKAAALINQNNDKAAEYYRKAMKSDRYNASYALDYAQIMNMKYKDTHDSAYLDNMKASLEKVRTYEPYNAKFVPTTIMLYTSNGMFEEGAAIANEMVDIQPMVEGVYMNKVQVNYQIAEYFIKNNQYSEALPYLNNVIEAEEQLKIAMDRSIKPFEVSKDIYKVIELSKNRKEIAEKKVNKENIQ